MPAADLVTRGRRLGFVLVAVALGMALGGFLAGGFGAQDGTSATAAVGPDVGDIRVGGNPAGPSDKVDGVGVGFARTEQGAVAAATNLVLTLEQAITAERDEAVRAYEILAAGASRDILVGELAASWDAVHTGVDANGPIGAELFVRTVPVGHELIRFDDDRATVDVWTLNLVAVSGMAEATATWETATIELVWEDDDWKVWSSTSTPGPSPAWGDPPPTEIDAFLATVDHLEGYDYVSD